MKKEIVIVIVLFLVPFVLAGSEEINVSYPSSVLVGDEFEVRIGFEDFDEDVYDIKFEIKNGSENIAEGFWDGVWKSTHYWMNNFINISEIEEMVVKLKMVDNYNGTNSFGIKIRDFEGDVFEFDGYVINISYVVEEEGRVNETEAEIYYELEWDEEDIENGDNFKIDVDVYNLENHIYDVRLWIEFKENQTIISEIYEGNKEKWLSGNYYVNEIFEGPGNKSDKIKIRIKEKYEDFYGNARIYFKLRDEDEWDKKIVVLEKSDPVVEENNVESEMESTKESVEGYIERGAEKEVIKLGQKIDSAEAEDLKVSGNIIYESKAHKIKKYSVYFFTLLIVIFCVLIVWRKLE